MTCRFQTKAIFTSSDELLPDLFPYLCRPCGCSTISVGYFHLNKTLNPHQSYYADRIYIQMAYNYSFRVPMSLFSNTSKFVNNIIRKAKIIKYLEPWHIKNSVKHL